MEREKYLFSSLKNELTEVQTKPYTLYIIYEGETPIYVGATKYFHKRKRAHLVNAKNSNDRQHIQDYILDVGLDNIEMLIYKQFDAMECVREAEMMLIDSLRGVGFPLKNSYTNVPYSEFYTKYNSETYQDRDNYLNDYVDMYELHYVDFVRGDIKYTDLLNIVDNFEFTFMNKAMDIYILLKLDYKIDIGRFNFVNIIAKYLYKQLPSSYIEGEVAQEYIPKVTRYLENDASPEQKLLALSMIIDKRNTYLLDNMGNRKRIDYYTDFTYYVMKGLDFYGVDVEQLLLEISDFFYYEGDFSWM